VKEWIVLTNSFFPVEDLERNDGSAEKPYYMSESLQKLLNKQNRGSKENVDAGAAASTDGAGGDEKK